MSNIDDSTEEISSIKGVLTARGSHSPEKKAVLEHKISISIASKIGRLPNCSMQEAGDVFSAIEASGLQPSARQTLNAAVDSKLEQDIDNDVGAKKASTKNQMCLNPRVWCNQEIIRSLQGRSPTEVKNHMLRRVYGQHARPEDAV